VAVTASAGLLVDWPDADARRADAAAKAAEEAARRAREAGFYATPRAVQTDGPVWEAITAIASERDAAVIVAGARGLTGIERGRPAPTRPAGGHDTEAGWRRPRPRLSL
jgi:nucleotide-binding universal stress UspA family protein